MVHLLWIHDGFRYLSIGKDAVVFLHIILEIRGYATGQINLSPLINQKINMIGHQAIGMNLNTVSARE
jgi:hypothetical protein